MFDSNSDVGSRRGTPSEEAPKAEREKASDQVVRLERDVKFDTLEVVVIALFHARVL